MTDLNEIMDKLIAMGSEQTKQIFLRHGAKEPLFGVKVGDLKKLVKDVKKKTSISLVRYTKPEIAMRCIWPDLPLTPRRRQKKCFKTG